VNVSDRPQLPYEFTVLNNDIPNAWALPGGKIAVNRGLLTELDNEAELAAVLGHEIVHAAARHGAQAMQRGILTQAALIGLGAAMQDTEYQDIIFVGAGLSAQLITQRYSRGAELEADRYGIQYMKRAGYDPQAAVTLQETFVRLAEGKDSDWLSGLFASHPPSRERVQKNQQLVAAMGSPGGTLGEEAYQAALRNLEQAAPAYEKLAQGRAALQRGDTAQSLRLAREGMQLLPQEAAFFGLAARARSAQGDMKSAKGLLDQAIAKNGEYFDYYLLRGYVQHQLGDVAGSKQDLMRSSNLLPTAQAHHALGMIELEAGNQALAIKHFSFAAENDSPAGQASRQMLQRLGYVVGN
jgi:predicted Zn-dependent protease